MVLPYMNKIQLDELEILKNMSLEDKNLFFYIQDISSYVVEKDTKSKLEILVSILLMINVADLCFFRYQLFKIKGFEKKNFCK